MYAVSFSHKLSRRNALTVAMVGLAVSALVAALATCGVAPLARLDNAGLDALLAAARPAHPAAETVVIDIDEVSLSAVGQWPWPRYRVADLIDRIAAARPAAIALDILLPEEDRSSLDNLRKTFKHDFGLDIGFTGVPAGLEDNDGFLGQEMARADVVGSSFLYFDHLTTAPPCRRASCSTAAPTCWNRTTRQACSPTRRRSRAARAPRASSTCTTRTASCGACRC